MSSSGNDEDASEGDDLKRAADLIQALMALRQGDRLSALARLFWEAETCRREGDFENYWNTLKVIHEHLVQLELLPDLARLIETALKEHGS